MLFTNSMWTILWCKAVPYARHISSKIMASCNHSITLSSTTLHLHHPDLEGFRPGRRNCRSCWIHFLVANPGYVCLHCVLHLPNLPTSTGQEHDNSLFGSIFTCNPVVFVLANGSEVQVWTCRCIGSCSFSILDPQYGSAHVYFLWRMPWNLEGFLTLGFQGSLACYQAFSIIWGYGLVRPFSNILCKLVFRKLMIKSRFVMFFGLIYIIRPSHIIIDSIYINKSIRKTMKKREEKGIKQYSLFIFFCIFSL